MASRYAGALHVEGLRELQAALRAMDRTLPRQLRVAHLDVAKYVAGRARARAESLGSVQAKVAPSVGARAEQRGAGMKFGGARYPMAMGANFGAGHNIPRHTSRGVVRGWNQFPAWGGNQHAGGANDLFFFRTLREESSEIESRYTKSLGELIARHFPD